MKQRHLAVIFTCALMFIPSAHGESGWTDYVTIGELVPTSLHYYEIRLPVKENPSGCKNATWFYQDYSATGSDFMFRTFLQGVSSGIQVRVFVTGRCNIKGYAEISSVSVTR